MRNRRSLRFFERAGTGRCLALNEEVLVMSCRSQFKDKSLRALDYGLTDPSETGRPTAHLQTVFDGLFCKLARLCDETAALPVRRRTVSIDWEETGERLFKINVKICANCESSSAKENSATEHASSPAAAAHSHARPCNAETNPATESARLQGHSNQS